jgi:hypothetical protein
MGKINAGRMILGGVVAGIIINLFEGITHGVFLASRDTEMMTSLNRPVGGSANQIIALNVWGFALGILTVWLYAAIRPRMGAGPKAAACAGLFVWATASVLAAAVPAILGIYRLDLTLTNIAIELPMLVIASIAGAAVYKENATESNRASAARA